MVSFREGHCVFVCSGDGALPMPPFGATDSTAASWNKKGSLVKADFTEMDSFGGLLLMEKMLHQLTVKNSIIYSVSYIHVRLVQDF